MRETRKRSWPSGRTSQEVASVARSEAHRAGEPLHDLRRYAIVPVQGGIVQRMDNLAPAAAAAQALPQEVLEQAWDPDTMQGANCHGYSLDGGHHSALPIDLLRGFDQDRRVEGHEVALFLDTDEAIQHSGRITDEGVRHLTDGVGVRHTPGDRNDRMGYHERINSVEHAVRFRQVQHARLIEESWLSRLRDVGSRLMDAAVHYEVHEDPAVLAMDERVLQMEDVLRSRPLATVMANRQAALQTVTAAEALIVRLPRLSAAAAAATGSGAGAGGH